MYNESENVGPFYERLQKVLDQMGESYEIICVNDGSTDDTMEKLLKIREMDSNVKIIDFSRNFGKEIALTAGIDFSSGEAIIPIDADLQDPPEIIPELISKWREGYDVVYATRLSREGESWIKRVTAALFYRMAKKIMHINIPKDTGDFRLMSKIVVETLKDMRERNRFMKGLFAWVGFPSSVVYYNREIRYTGKTKWNYWKLWQFAIDGITSFSYIPLQIATYFGFIVAFFKLYLCTIYCA
jgi:glycosyltransferase involved in cell wall biosynthesis